MKETPRFLTSTTFVSVRASSKDKDAFRGSSALFTSQSLKKRDNSDGEIHIV